MELDDFKNNKNSNIPPETGHYNKLNIQIDQLIEDYKADVKKQRETSLFIITILISLSVIYIARLNNEGGFISIGLSLIITGFVMGALYIYIRYRKPSNSHYLLPVMSFIKKAEKRLTYMNITDWLIVIPLLIILGTGGGIIFINSFLKYTENFYLLLAVWILFFLFLSVFALYTSKKNWMKEHGRLLDEIHRLKESMVNKE